MFEFKASTFDTTFLPSKARLMTVVTTWSTLYAAILVEGMLR